MSGHELKDEQIGSVRALTDEQRTRAAVRVAQAAVKAKPAKGTKKKHYTRQDVIEFLEMLGLREYDTPAAVDPNGQTVYRPNQKDAS